MTKGKLGFMKIDGSRSIEDAPSAVKKAYNEAKKNGHKFLAIAIGSDAKYFWKDEEHRWVKALIWNETVSV